MTGLIGVARPCQGTDYPSTLTLLVLLWMGKNLFAISTNGS